MTAHQPDLFAAAALRPAARLLVTGGRDFNDRDFTFLVLDQLHAETPVAVVIHGAATGADTLAAEWANARGILHDPQPADWSNIDAPGALIRFNRRGQPYNAKAGFQRNSRMVFEGRPTVAVALPGGNGTDDCVKKVASWNRDIMRRVRDGDLIRFIDHREGPKKC